MDENVRFQMDHAHTHAQTHRHARAHTHTHTHTHALTRTALTKRDRYKSIVTNTEHFPVEHYGERDTYTPIVSTQTHARLLLY